MAMTFNSLVQQVLAYLDRNDVSTVNQVPNFISQAEQRIATESKSLGLETYVYGAFTPSQSIIQKPARWRRTLSMNYGLPPDLNQRQQLQLRSYEFIRNYAPNPNDTSSLPMYYSDYGFDHILIGPTPAAAYPFELCFLQLPEPITVNNQTNWLTNYAPSLLLYAALLEAVPYLKADERVPIWQQYYDRALATLNAQDDQRVVDRASNRAAD